MNLVSLPVALLNLNPATQLLVLIFAGWALAMFIALHIDGTRSR